MSDLPAGFVLDQQPSLPQGFELDKPGLGEDIAKSAASGLGNATIGALGTVGDLRDLASAGLNKLGLSGVKDAAYNAIGQYTPWRLIAGAPNSADVRATVTNPIVSPDYEPQSALGTGIKTAAEFTPNLLTGGEGSLGARLLKDVLAPAAGSEALGQLTKGSEAEPWARVGGALLGSVGATRAANKVAENAALKAATPELDTLKSSTSAGYDALTSRNVATPLAANTLDNLANDIRDTLNRQGKRPVNAGSIHAAVDELRTPATAGAPDVADLVASRQSIKELLGAPDTNKAGAFTALGKIEKAIEDASPGTMQKIRELDKDWGAVRANEALDAKVARAENRAVAADSGLNLGNKIRQKVSDLLLSNQARYLSADTKATLQKIVDGTATQNTVRWVANWLGKGSGLGGVVAGTALGHLIGKDETSDALGLGLGFLGGRGLNAVYNRSVSRAAARAAETIRRNSSIGRQNLSPTIASNVTPGVAISNPGYVPLPKPSNAAERGLLSALLARPIQ